MLDIKLVREKPGLVKKNLKKRQDPEILERLDELVKKDADLRKSMKRLDGLRHKRNVVTREIAELKAKKKPAEKKIREIKSVGREIGELDKQVLVLKEKTRELRLAVPNLLHGSVPFGKDDKNNKVLRKVGKKPKFSFKPKNHLEIAEGLDLIDTERAGKVAGSGFVYLKGELALLDLAIQRYAVDFLRKKGYLLVEPPLMIRRKPYEGVTDLSDFEMVTYKIDGEDVYLIATSEHPMAAMHMDEILDKTQLPIKLVGLSPCFRKEVGTHGKYTKGLFRTHHFNKVEQFIFCPPEESWKFHEELQKNCEQLYKNLGLHFRVVNVCTGDIGTIAAKKYDTEVWMADGKYREIGSNSNCTDYQARRLSVRFREKEGQPAAGFVHTLNNTALATSRTIIAILEQFQRADGSVKVPKVLQPYMGGLKKII